MIIDNVILVGIVLSLILCFCIILYLEKGVYVKTGPFTYILLTLLLTTIFWAVGYLIFWILKIFQLIL